METDIDAGGRVMTPGFARIDATIDIAGPRDAVFAHWLDPAARQRWEAPPESGMRYRNFAPEAGGLEEIEIVQDGRVVGEMHQRIVVLDRPQLIVSQITGTFGGVTSMAMQVSMYFDEIATGTRIGGTSQVVDTSGRDVAAEHDAGWRKLLDSFAADFERHGPAAP